MNFLLHSVRFNTFKKLKLLTIVGLLPSVFMGCVRSKSNVQCTSVQSAAQDIQVNSPGIPGYGGYITLSEYQKTSDSFSTDSNLELIKSTCTVTLEFLNQNENSTLRLWSARHCLRYDVTDSIALKIFAKGIEFEIPIVVPELEVVKQIRKSSQLNIQSKTKLVEIFKNLPSNPENLVPATLLTASDNTLPTESVGGTQSSESENIFATFNNMENIDVKIPSNVASEHKDALSNISRDAIKFNESTWNKFSAPVSEQMKEWTRLNLAVTEMRKSEGIAKLAIDLKNCSNKKVIEKSELCSQKEQIASLLDKNLSTEMLDIFHSSERAAALAPNLDLALKQRKDLWKKIRTDLLSNQNEVFVHSISAMPGLEQGTEGEDRFMMIPSSYLSNSTDGTFATAKDQGFLYSQSLQNSRIIFQKKDIGALFSYKGVVPLAVVANISPQSAKAKGASTIKKEVKPKGETYLDSCSP